MKEKRLQCTVKSNSNVVKITSVPIIKASSGISKRKVQSNAKGRWSVEERSAFINCNLNTHYSLNTTWKKLD